MRLQIRTPGDLESTELVAADRVPPGPGQVEVAVSASSINLADVVTAVGPDVTDHKVGDHVGGLSQNGYWGTFITGDARLAVTLPPGP